MRIFKSALIVFLVTLLLSGNAAPLLAQTIIPGLPSLYAGNITIYKTAPLTDGIPAPIGSVVSVKSGSSVINNFVTTVAGQFGSPPFSYFKVPASIPAGTAIDFYINGVKADQSDTFSIGNMRPGFNLTVKDIVGPTITNYQPTGTVTTTATTISAQYSDVLAGLGSTNSAVLATLTLDGTNLISSALGNPTIDKGLSLFVTGLSQGSHSVSVTVKDRVGNTASQTWIFIVNTSAPVISSISPVGTIYTTSTTLSFNVTAPFALESLMVNGTEKKTQATKTDTSVMITLSGLAQPSTHTVNLLVRNTTTGATANQTWTFSVAAPPTVSQVVDAISSQSASTAAQTVVAASTADAATAIINVGDTNTTQAANVITAAAETNITQAAAVVVQAATTDVNKMAAIIVDSATANLTQAANLVVQAANNNLNTTANLVVQSAGKDINKTAEIILQSSITGATTAEKTASLSKTADIILQSAVTGTTTAEQTASLSTTANLILQSATTGTTIAEKTASLNQTAEIIVQSATKDASKTADIIVQSATKDASGTADIILQSSKTGTTTADKAASLVKTADVVVQAVTKDINKTADLVTQMVTKDVTTASNVVSQVITNDSTKAGTLLNNMTTQATASTMQNIVPAKLDQVIPKMSENKLVGALPEMTAAKLGTISLTVLLAALPNVPTVQLAGQVSPTQPPFLPPVSIVTETATNARYLSVLTAAGDWVRLAFTPRPLTEVMLKTKTALANVGTDIDFLTFATLSAAAQAKTPPGQNVANTATYFKVTLTGATDNDIDSGYIGFEVEKAWLTANNFHKWGVYLSRFDTTANTWMQLPVKRVDGPAPPKVADPLYEYYAATTPRMSEFAITGSNTPTPPEFSVSNLKINTVAASPTTVVGLTTGAVNITATLKNETAVTKTFPVSLFINSMVEQTITTASVAAGATTDIGYTISKTINAEYVVRVESSTGSFLLDTVAPAISNNGPTGTTTSASATISALFSDTMAGIDTSSVVLKLDGKTLSPTVTSSGVSIIVSGLISGSHTVDLTVKDAIGNTSTLSWNFIVSVGAIAGGGAGGGGGGGALPTTPTTPSGPSLGDVKNTIETKSPAEAAKTIGEAPVAVAAQAIQESTTAKAAQIVVEMTTTAAAQVLSQVALSKAGDILSTVPVTKAADIVGQITTARAVDIVNQITPAKAGEILGTMSTAKAGQVMEQINTTRLEQVLPSIPAKALQDRLPEISPAKQYEIKRETIFQLLPQAPTEQLVKETPPVVAPELAKPAPTVVSATQTDYAVAQTRAGEWATLVGTPEPITSVLAKFKESLTNIKVSLEKLAEKPAQIKSDPVGQKINSYVRIDLPQAASGKIDVGHIGFKVEKSWLQSNNIHKWSIVLSRYEEGNGWVALPTKRVSEDATSVTYTATTPKFSTFAISGSVEVPSQEFRVNSLSLSPDKGIAGQPITVTAEVENLVKEARRFAIPLWVNGTVDSSRMDTVANGSKATFTYTLSRPAGTYEIRVDRQIKSVVVAPLPPKPVTSFSASSTRGNAPLEVKFTDKSEGNVTSRLWDFGDGTTSSDISPSKTYRTAGVYTVKFTTTGPGGSDTSTITITVIAPPVTPTPAAPTLPGACAGIPGMLPPCAPPAPSAPSVTPTPIPPTPPAPPVTPTPIPATPPAPPVTPPTPIILIVGIVVALAIIGSVLYFMRRKRASQ